MTATIPIDRTGLDFKWIAERAGGRDPLVTRSGDGYLLTVEGTTAAALQAAIAEYSQEGAAEYRQSRRVKEIETAVDNPAKESVYARRLLYDVQLDMVNEAVDAFNEVFQALGIEKRLDYYTREDVTKRVKAKARQQ